jgi:hypothetical protein
MTDESATKYKISTKIKKLSQKFAGIISSKKQYHPIEQELLEKNIFLQNELKIYSDIPRKKWWENKK